MEENAEKKNIARLDFNIKSATDKLDEINKKLKEVSESSEAYAKIISKNINSINLNKIDVGTMIDTTKVKNKMNTITGYTTKFGNNLKYTLSGKIDFSKIIDVNKFKKDFENLESIGKSGAKKIATTIINEEIKTANNRTRLSEQQQAKEKITNLNLIKNEQTTADKIKVIEANLAAYKEKRVADSALAHEKADLRVAKSTQTLYDKISEYAKTYIIYQGFNELRQGIKETIDEMVEVEYQMVQIDRVLNDSSLNIDNYRDKLIQLAYDYGNTFNNVADITLRLAQAGYDTEESLALSEKTLLALNTAELNATQATEDMVAVMAQWGLTTGTANEQAKTYGDIIDKINKVADNFPTTSEDILDALKKTSSAFNLAGASIDETIATIVAAEKASQRGGKVIGTALSNIVQQLKAENKLDLAEKLGLNFFKDANKTEFRPLMEIFEEMSTRMQSLKEQGKESSVEMQNLLEMFTVFRRNIGASLLGEMAGEESTYAQVLETSLNSVGYSLQENQKHMQTAKAAQAQFNAELLKLKTQVWDDGLEDVFRSILETGTNMIGMINKLTKEVGLVPTAIGGLVAIVSTLKSHIKISDIISLRDQIKAVNKVISENKTAISADNDVLAKSNQNFKNYVVSVGKGKASIVGYTGSLIASKAATVAMTAATIALNAAITAGLTIAITWLAKKISDAVNAQENYIKQQDEIKQTAEDNAQAIEEEITQLDELKKQYKELATKNNRTSEEDQKIYELQEQINQLIKDSGKQVELVTEKVNEQGKKVLEVNVAYDEQLDKIKSVQNELGKQRVNELKTSVDASKKSVEELKKEVLDFSGKMQGLKGNYSESFGNVLLDLKKIVFEGTTMGNVAKGLEAANVQLKDFYAMWGTLPQEIKDSNLESQLRAIMQTMDTDSAVDMLDNLRTELLKIKTPGEEVQKAIGAIGNTIDLYKSKMEESKTAIENYKNALGELYLNMGFVSDYSETLRTVWGTYSDLEEPKKLIESIEEINTNFSNGKIDIEEYFNTIQEKIGEIDLSEETENLEAYQAIFAMTAESMGSAIETIRAGFETDTIDFTEYSQQIAEASENMLALYTNQQKLQKNEKGLWVTATGEVNEFASSLQSGITTIQDMSGVLDVLHQNMGALGEAAASIFDDGKIAAEEFATLTTNQYNNLVTNVTTALNNLKATNSQAFQQIVNDTTAELQIQENQMIDSEGRIQEGFLNNYGNMAATVSSVVDTTEGAVTTTSQALGKVIEALADTIENFSYEISASINKLSFTNFYIGDVKTPLKVPEFTLSITGKDTSKGGISNALRTLAGFVSNYDNSFSFKPPKLPKTTPTTPPATPPRTTSPSSSSKGSSGGSSSSSSRDTSAEDAERAREQAYKDSLDAFEDSIDERERLEQRWVKRQKELGLLSNKDYLFITQQRIERYKKYLEEVKNATWMSEEDKLRLTKEYSEKIEDIEVEYLGFLKDQLEDEIDAIEDANKEKIQLIEDEADAKIAALKKVDSERDKDRELEDYQKEKQSILDEIAYWEQRTGREAQENLVDARKRLEELDADWQDTQEDWAIEDQIAKIEEERDAEIAAIEKAQEEEIKALQAIYDAKVKMYAETGNLMYEESTMQSQRLYESYKTNFIDPLSKEFDNLNKKITSNISSAGKTTPSTSQPKQEQEQKYETYTIKYGDTLSGIAKRFDTTVDKIMKANPYIKDKNKIYAGKTLQIPKFHEGGIVGGNQEAFALLKPHEVILKPEWADGINKLAKMARNVQNPISANSTVVEVKGDLVKIDAKINDKTDAEYLTRRIEKMLKDKFNIKK